MFSNCIGILARTFYLANGQSLRFIFHLYLYAGMGFIGGISGVVLKPIEGARDEGVGGFFKGVGKGVAGLVTRPTGGIVDFASGTFDTVKRATEVNDVVSDRVRPAR